MLGGGFDMRMGPDSRIWNTFDAHRLLHWAGTVGPAEQRALKAALFAAHFTDGKALPDAEVPFEVAITTLVRSSPATLSGIDPNSEPPSPPCHRCWLLEAR